MIKATLADIISSANANYKMRIREGDYKGDDGLWYCGRCHTKKEHIIQCPNSPLTGLKVKCLCDCQKAVRDGETYKINNSFKEQEIEDAKDECFPDKSYTEFTFANDDGSDERIRNECIVYCTNFNTFQLMGKGLVFYGNVGTGKTFRASQIANELIKEKKKVKFTSISRMAERVRQSYGQTTNLIDGLKKMDLVIIDDLGTERNTEFIQEQLFNIVNTLYESKIPMIFTTNLKYEEITNPKDLNFKRIFDRINERCTILEIKGKSKRKGVTEQ